MNNSALLANNPLWLVDVGASGGIDPRWAALTEHYKAILFEPDPAVYDILNQQSRNNILVFNTALSDSAGLLTFHVCKKRQVSSIYRPNFEFLNKFPNADRFAITNSVQLRVDTLSNQLKSHDIADIDFVKIDTQGSELPILMGSINHLDTVVGLELEVEFAQMYKDQPLFSDVNSFVVDCGFELFDIKRYYWKRTDSLIAVHKGQLVFADTLYFRSPEQVLLMNGVSQEKIAKAIFVYLGYGYLDLAESLFIDANAKGRLDSSYHSAITALLSRYRKANVIRHFIGRGKIQRLVGRIERLFAKRGWYSGKDRFLGNPLLKDE